MKKKKLHIFKNDPFNIKYKIFRAQLKHAMKDDIEIRTKALAIYLKTITLIGYPVTDGQVELLKDTVKKYDENIQKLEEYVAKARKYTEYHKVILRDATEEERESVNDYIESISEKTNVNFYNTIKENMVEE